jgi:hypothetical protein
MSIFINAVCNFFFFNVVTRALDNLLHQCDDKHHIDVEDSAHHKYVIISSAKYKEMVYKAEGKYNDRTSP